MPSVIRKKYNQAGLYYSLSFRALWYVIAASATIQGEKSACEASGFFWEVTACKDKSLVNNIYLQGFVMRYLILKYQAHCY